jgi:anti-anti-sigma factor
MAAKLAEANVRLNDGSAVIDLSGDIDRSAEAVLAEAYEKAATAGSTTVVLNFAETEFINSTGIAVIVGIIARARQEGIAVGACGLSEHYQHIFQITRLADFMPMFPDEASALSDSAGRS